jgi:hypothetical protein
LYENGDTLIYQSNNGKKDSLIVYSFDKGYRSEVIANDDKDKYEFEQFSLNKIKELTTTHISISRMAPVSIHPEYVSIEFFEHIGSKYYTLDYGFRIFTDSIHYVDTIYRELQIENRIYKNVYSLKNFIDSTSIIPPRKNIYYSQSYGLLKYDVNDETWSLSEIKPER